ncbi:snaclec coagulation factor X-activating enzyme light chain 1-like isoform X2 [Hemicordylus capensis]|uniref:snaclec coagulation factor X-activating enzyme light chain 1-like isoform X2 n=1 Tax=Hemicordylus capensis TaxID=884348 RepID=UPI0023037224|nr:snaclec coagulation factor X-activating enzyme light chain 1-like isoform X2 [Hemicordylus capensis]
MNPWSSLCFLLLIFFINAACSQNCLCAQGACQSGWVQYQSACYKAVSEPNNWTDAEISCSSLGKNAHLASIHSAEENDFIFHLMGKPLEYTKGQAYWIGAHDSFKEGVFVWTDGSEFSYQTFGNGQPDNLNGEHYLGSWFLQDGFITWNDYKPSWQFPSVCKYALGSSMCCSSQ